MHPLGAPLSPPVGAGPGEGGAEVGEADALAAVAELVEAGLPRRRAAELVSRLTGVPRNRLYSGSL